MKTNINFLKFRKPLFILSSILIVLSIWFAFFPKEWKFMGPLTPKGLNLGIDFQGGLIHQVLIYTGMSAEDVRTFAEKAGLGNEIQQVIIPESRKISNETSYMIKAIITEEEQKLMKEKNITASQFLSDKIKTFYAMIQEKTSATYEFKDKELERVKELYPDAIIPGEILPTEDTDVKTLTNRVVANVVKESENVISPVYSQGLRLQGLFLVLFVIVIIQVYIWIRFDFKYGLGAMIFLAHDTIITLGFISIMQLEFDMTLMASILTLIGYSINDTIVVYDRIRENHGIMKDVQVSKIFNISINQTLSRTIVTAVTVFIAAFTLYLFGGPKIQGFSTVFCFGVILGTYSSIFIAAPVVDMIESKFYKKARILDEKMKKKEEKKELSSSENGGENTTNETNGTEENKDNLTLSKKQLKKLMNQKK